VPALLGLWLYRARLRSSPEAWVVAVFACVYTLLLWRVAAKAGYISDRHGIILVLFGSVCAAHALLAIAAVVVRLLPRGAVMGPALTLALLAALPVTGLVRTLKPLHDERTGFKEVGLWLGTRRRPTSSSILLVGQLLLRAGVHGPVDPSDPEPGPAVVHRA
jgi:hypothetical protein